MPVQPSASSVVPAWPHLLAEVLAAPERLRVHFQPIVDLRAGVVRAYEALARPTGDQPPAAWFAAAANLGCAGALEAQVLEAALTQRPLLGRGRSVAVNLSASALRSDDVRAVLSRHGRLDALVVEVTAQGPDVDPTSVGEALAALRAAGAQVAADDADALDAELLAALSPRYVKVHHRVAGDALPIAARLGATVVAKGVEADEDLEALGRLGVPLAQGFALGVPSAVPGELDHAIAAGLRGLAIADRRAVVTLGELAAGTSLVDLPDGTLELPASTPLGEAARFAMTRQAPARFAPVVAVDDAGRRIGAVPVERLVVALAG
ncbi:EAL domain-containing protein [Conexibacter sp. SYSU D00693]|uniref:EAL domain-containing protein n=1 Tax=Conexibacter sp. SYSU D00693 TaxID=2812560 RepID=UPI00196B9E18|nr:EAL domain-containing protein [Conexibacter sp. SYSU D00693]